MKIETLAVHAGSRPDPITGAVAASIDVSTTFQRDPDGSYPRGFIYSRTDNPNRRSLEQCLAALEGGADAAAFASGSAATMSIFQALSSGDHVIAPNDSYYGTALLLRETFTRWGLAVSFVDMTDVSQVRRELRETTRLIWIETPSNPLLKITDIAEISRIAHERGALCVCDNTWATPVGQSPFRWGADLVMHATTKYLGGHSDVVGGAVVTRTENDFFMRIRNLQASGGAVPSPFDCWLALRGIRTLPYRIRAQSESALKIAGFLQEHAKVEAVHYPGLKTHAGHDIAARQMSLYGGMLSFQVKGDQSEAMKVAAAVKLFTRATSLGGVESLIEHRASIEGATTRTPRNLLRISVGLEHPDDLIEDLHQALDALR